MLAGAIPVHDSAFFRVKVDLDPVVRRVACLDGVRRVGQQIQEHLTQLRFGPPG